MYVVPDEDQIELDSLLGGWPIQDEDGKVIGYHGLDGREHYTDFVEEEPDSDLYYTFKHVSKTKNYWGTKYPVTHYLFHKFACPECGGYTEAYSDCPGYGNPVMVCGNFYSEETITGKYVSAMACGNSRLYVCINPKCEWEWRTDNRRSGCGVEPSWAQEAVDYERMSYGNNEDD
jgi:hypothetical protein